MFRAILMFMLLAFSFAKRPQLDGRIVGGHKTNIFEFPYQLSFQYNSQHLCGASIISDTWALSAAHCIITMDTSNLQFRAGSSFRSKGGQVFQISKIIVHPDWNPTTMDHDFSLIQISGSFPLGTPGIDKIALTNTAPAVNNDVVVSGWGLTKEGSGSIPKELRSVTIKMVDWTSCNKNYEKDGGITNTMICAADPRQDSCQGDSGGPLVDTVTSQLVGVVSWGYGCARIHYPGIYSNIAAVRSWITTETGV